MLDRYGNGVVCLGVLRNGGRMPLSIAQLINVKDSVLNSIDGFQLFRYCLPINEIIRVE